MDPSVQAHPPFSLMLKGVLKIPEKARRAFPDRLGSLVAGFEDREEEENSGSDKAFEPGEELETFHPNLLELDCKFDDYVKDDDKSSHVELDPSRVRPKPDADVAASVSVKEIIAADEKRSDLEYELSRKEINLEKLQRIASSGLPEGGLRATAWKLLLGYLPSSRDLWEKEMAENRSKYSKLKEELLLSPSEFSRRNEVARDADGQRDDSNVDDGPLERHDVSNEDHPLNISKASVWHQFFQFSEIAQQIDRDLQRTHPDMKFFSGESLLSRKHREAMRNVLLLFAKLNPEISYVQGMNEVLAPIYYVFSTDTDEHNAANAEADSFSCFVRLLSDSVDHFCQKLDNSSMGIHSTLCRLSELLKAHDEELWRHLEYTTKVNPQYYAFRWITLLLTQEFDFQSVLRIWDTLLSNPFGVQDMLLRVCCAMLLCVKSRLLGGDFIANMKLLQHFPKINIEHLLEVAKGITPDTSSFHLPL
ncbi:TBC domain-containing protein C1952.17c-like isoform X2 [Diospyros lotus]|uniref:TBC domain-containing protein C1952.17c-like isoform X2 n=1 Tax=Diospyros lotus TaxID=55363 RepID=UPI0022521BD0|nr:TBC domain-containing protein C1952.17c-like isoform X2 [Diospyros lotus]